MLRTTINIRHDIFTTLGFAASKLGKSRRDIVVMLLMKLLRDIERFQGGFTLVRYQARGALTNWHCFPISFKKEENEFFTDLRKLSKCSVSYLVAIAAEQYLNELLNEGANRHNYAEFTAYAIGKRIERDVVCWEFYWGNPGDIPIRHSTTRIYRCIKDSSAGR